MADYPNPFIKNLPEVNVSASECVAVIYNLFSLKMKIGTRVTFHSGKNSGLQCPDQYLS